MLAVVAGVVALGWTAVRGIERGQVELEAERRGFCRRLLLLAGWQVALFSGMEVVERIVAGVAPGTLLETPAFAVGVLLQLVVAAAVLLVLGGFEHLVAEVARRFRRGRRHLRRARLGRLPEFSLSSRRLSPAAPRGPPEPASV